MTPADTVEDVPQATSAIIYLLEHENNPDILYFSHIKEENFGDMHMDTPLSRDTPMDKEQRQKPVSYEGPTGEMVQAIPIARVEKGVDADPRAIPGILAHMTDDVRFALMHETDRREVIRRLVENDSEQTHWREFLSKNTVDTWAKGRMGFSYMHHKQSVERTDVEGDQQARHGKRRLQPNGPDARIVKKKKKMMRVSLPTQKTNTEKMVNANMCSDGVLDGTRRALAAPPGTKPAPHNAETGDNSVDGSARQDQEPNRDLNDGGGGVGVTEPNDDISTRDDLETPPAVSCDSNMSSLSDVSEDMAQKIHQLQLYSGRLLDSQRGIIKRIKTHLKFNLRKLTVLELEMKQILREKAVSSTVDVVQEEVADDQNDVYNVLEIPWRSITQMRACFRDPTKTKAFGKLLKTCNPNLSFFVNDVFNKTCHEQLHCRLYQAGYRDSGGNGKYIHYGEEFYAIPQKMQDKMMTYMTTRLDLNTAKARTRFKTALNNKRKERHRRLRTMICKEARNDNCHPMFKALWLDREYSLGVFTTPAPIWPRYSKEDRDRYWSSYEDAFEEKLLEKAPEGLEAMTRKPKVGEYEHDLSNPVDPMDTS